MFPRDVERRCPHGCELKAFETNHSSYNCDVCRSLQSFWLRTCTHVIQATQCTGCWRVTLEEPGEVLTCVPAKVGLDSRGATWHDPVDSTTLTFASSARATPLCRRWGARPSCQSLISGVAHRQESPLRTCSDNYIIPDPSVSAGDSWTHLEVGRSGWTKVCRGCLQKGSKPGLAQGRLATGVHKLLPGGRVLPRCVASACRISVRIRFGWGLGSVLW